MRHRHTHRRTARFRAAPFAAVALAAVALAAPAQADITIGAILSLTGPAASLGVPERNVIAMLPQEIAGQKLHFVVLDDATDSTKAVQDFQKLVSEDKVDVVIGPTVTPPSLAAIDVAGSSETPMISLAGSNAVVVPQQGNRRWAFKLPVPESAMLAGPLDWLKQHGGKTVAAIAQATSFGDGFIAALEPGATARGIRYLGAEKYNLTDASVTPQVLKLMALHPDAIFIAGSGTPAAMPVLELAARGYHGMVIHNMGVTNPDFLRVAGHAADGIVLAASPVTVAEQLPADHPARAAALAYVKLYEGKYGANSRSLFGALAWDAWMLIERAVPVALKAGAPGSLAFRTALRDAMEHEQNLAGAAATYTMTPTDHSGTDDRSLVLVTVKDGHWVLLK
jgi:branched-chain amino acid transport system substrate-binding protein